MLYDRVLLWLLLGLITFGFIIVSSSSLSIGHHISNDILYFIKREIFYYSITFILSLMVLNISIITWKRYSYIILIFSIVMLLIVLFFNNSINGASRWIVWGVISVQPSELSKLSFVCYLAGYLDRKSNEVRSTFWGILKPIIIMLFIALLLMAQPDFGSIIILFIITLSVLFLFGAKLWQLVLIFMLNIFLMILSVVFEPYRIKRVLAFLNPWQDPFGSGYQLVQSFIAFGRGNYYGKGLGNSIQKLEYLPEAHTDFIFSILAEEFGLIGSVFVLVMLFILVCRAFKIGCYALNIQQRFAGILAYSIGIWIGFQTFFNVGVTTGILPTKGLTLPFISYGGSSFLIITISAILLIRIDFESRLIKHQVFLKNVK